MGKFCKKALLLGAVLMGAIGFAQTDTADLDVVLNDIQSITVNSPTVTLTFATASDYTNGVSSPLTDHLAIVSTEDFDVTAHADHDLTLTGDPNTIPASTITLTPAAGTGSTAGGTYSSAVALAVGAVNAVKIMDEIPADLDGQYDMTYNASGGANYLNQNTGTYEATITYTLLVD